MNRRPILSCWIDEALELEEENAALRAALVSLIAWIGTNQDLAAFARQELAERFEEAA